VAHACNPSYSVGSDQEDRNSKPAGQIVHETLSRKYPSQKRLAEWLKVKSLSSSPGTTKKKKKNHTSYGTAKHTHTFCFSKQISDYTSHVSLQFV
jgi:hypothetical protein